MMRVEAFRQTGGFRDDLIAGEEPELCVRIRAAGWRIFRLDEEMTLHDAAMTHFSQWWRRAMRAGYAFAEGAHLHGAPPERHWVREARRSLLWGLGVPAVVALACVVLGAKGLALLLAYPAQILRLALRAKGSTGDRLLRASAMVIGKFPEALGVMKFRLLRLRGRKGRLIEYK
jgi:GT2 family glycosyltransferase